MGMGEFNSDNHYIYFFGQESLRSNDVVIIVNKRVQNAILDTISLMTEWSLFISIDLWLISVQSLIFQPFSITVIQVYAPTSKAEEAEVEWFYEDLQDLLELAFKKDIFFIIGDWNAKVGNPWGHKESDMTEVT